jgi:cytochrome c oxidase assembly factor CtaG
VDRGLFHHLPETFVMTTQQFLLSTWGWNPVVIGICVAAVATYGFRYRRQNGYFLAAIVLFYLTLASPVSALANGYLFSAHMLQHLLLLLVVPALALLGLPELKADSGIRIPPLAGWLGGLSAMWIWHERTLCNAATTTTSVRVIQIISLIALGLMFWWPIIGPQTERRLPPLLGVVYLFSSCVGCTILGILITFAPVGVVCPVYLHPVDRLGILPLLRENWGFTPAFDQQAGGLMMWVPACGIYISGVIALLARWYRAGETSASAAAREPEPVFPPPRTTRGNA